MKRQRFNKAIVFCTATVLLLCGSIPSIVSAQAANANAAQGLSISPALVELNANYSTSYEVSLKVMNVTSSDLVYSYTVNDFGSSDETGTPHVVMDDKLPATASVITWVAPVPQFTLQAHQTKTITVKINVPSNAEPGGHYAVLRFSGQAPDVVGSGVGLSVSAGVLLLVRVGNSNDITEKASLASFYSEQNGKQSWFFEDSPKDNPITFVTRIQNDGNVHIKPIGNVEIRDMFGNLVKTLSVGNDQSNVLPQSIRRYDVTYDNSWMIGKYTASLALGYGTKGQAITSTFDFWVIPYKLILAGIFILATIIFILSRMIRVYNRHIIEKSKNESSNKNKKHTKKKD